MRIFNSIATETRNENEVIVSIEIVTNEYSQVEETPSTFTREDGTVENFIEYEYLDSNIIGTPHTFTYNVPADLQGVEKRVGDFQEYYELDSSFSSYVQLSN